MEWVNELVSQLIGWLVSQLQYEIQTFPVNHSGVCWFCWLVSYWISKSKELLMQSVRDLFMVLNSPFSSEHLATVLSTVFTTASHLPLCWRVHILTPCKIYFNVVRVGASHQTVWIMALYDVKLWCFVVLQLVSLFWRNLMPSSSILSMMEVAGSLKFWFLPAKWQVITPTKQ